MLDLRELEMTGAELLPDDLLEVVEVDEGTRRVTGGRAMLGPHPPGDHGAQVLRKATPVSASPGPSTPSYIQGAAGPYGRLAATAPPQIRDEARILQAAYQELERQFATIGYDPKRVTVKIMAPVRTPEAAAAGPKLQDYIESTCTIDLAASPGAG